MYTCVCVDACRLFAGNTTIQRQQAFHVCACVSYLCWLNNNTLIYLPFLSLSLSLCLSRYRYMHKLKRAFNLQQQQQHQKRRPSTCDNNPTNNQRTINNCIAFQHTHPLSNHTRRTRTHTMDALRWLCDISLSWWLYLQGEVSCCVELLFTC